MAWYDSIIDFGGDVFDSVTGVVGEQYDSFREYQKTVQSEAAKDTANLRENEPVKGTSKDGSPVLATTAAPQNGAVMQSNQLIAGVDNKYLLIGGLVVAALLLKR